MWQPHGAQLQMQPGSICANYDSRQAGAAAHLEIVQPLLDLLHGGILEEVLAVIGALMDGYGGQIAVLQPKVLRHLQQATSALSSTIQANALPHCYTSSSDRQSSLKKASYTKLWCVSLTSDACCRMCTIGYRWLA